MKVQNSKEVRKPYDRKLSITDRNRIWALNFTNEYPIKFTKFDDYFETMCKIIYQQLMIKLIGNYDGKFNPFTSLGKVKVTCDLRNLMIICMRQIIHIDMKVMAIELFKKEFLMIAQEKSLGDFAISIKSMNDLENLSKRLETFSL